MRKRNETLFWAAIVVLSLGYIVDTLRTTPIFKTADSSSVSLMTSKRGGARYGQAMVKAQDRVIDTHKQRAVQMNADAHQASSPELQIVAESWGSTAVAKATVKEKMAVANATHSDQKALTEGLHGNGHVKTNYVPLP